MSECQGITKAIQELSKKIDTYKKEVDSKYKKLDSRLNNLERKVGGLDQDIKNIIPRVNSHETRIKKIESGGGNKQDYNLSLLRRRINIMGKQLTAIERNINALDNAGKQIITILKKFTKLFNIFK